MTTQKDLPQPYEQNNKKDISYLNIEAALNLIPYVGGFFATYFSEVRSKRVNERMQKYFQHFSQRLKELDEEKIDHDYLKSEEFAEFFMQGAEQAARSTTDKRIRRFANILANNSLKSSKSRSRTQSIMSFVDRISDLDAFVLLCYGHPELPSLRAKTKDEAIYFVKKLENYLNIESLENEDIVESIVYMDNLGITWVNEKQNNDNNEKGKDLILKDFSSFRTPLGDSVAAMIAPPDFYLEKEKINDKSKWPEGYISIKFNNLGQF